MNLTHPLARISITVIVLCFLSACAAIPKGTSLTNRAVSDSIERLKERHKSTIRAFAESARASVNHAWDNAILDRVVRDELRRACGDERRACSDTLTPEQAATAAATAADIREELLKKVNDHEAKLLAQAEAYYDGVKSTNDVVTGYLASLEESKAATDALLGRILSLAGINDSDILVSIGKILAISQNPSKLVNNINSYAGVLLKMLRKFGGIPV